MAEVRFITTVPDRRSKRKWSPNCFVWIAFFLVLPGTGCNQSALYHRSGHELTLVKSVKSSEVARRSSQIKRVDAPVVSKSIGKESSSVRPASHTGAPVISEQPIIDQELAPTIDPENVCCDCSESGCDNGCDSLGCKPSYCGPSVLCNPFALLAAQSRSSWESLKGSFHANSAMAHHQWSETRIAKWAAKKREEANAPPWPRFHPVPTRNVFYPDPANMATQPTELYGQFCPTPE